ncbi:hypothetical protein SEA_BIGMAU_1 [Mycobacterium phage BigMau]|nr:hypothetical protein SEA_BIGMAU_1 [Mycobacterium phage BigMau]
MPPESPVDGRTVRIDRWHRRQAKTAAEPSPADARVERYSCEVRHILRVKRKSGGFLTYGGVRERGSAERPHPDIGSCRGSRTERDYPLLATSGRPGRYRTASEVPDRGRPLWGPLRGQWLVRVGTLRKHYSPTEPVVT